jgi:hypothetical protein
MMNRNINKINITMRMMIMVVSMAKKRCTGRRIQSQRIMKMRRTIRRQLSFLKMRSL